MLHWIFKQIFFPLALSLSILFSSLFVCIQPSEMRRNFFTQAYNNKSKNEYLFSWHFIKCLRNGHIYTDCGNIGSHHVFAACWIFRQIESISSIMYRRMEWNLNDATFKWTSIIFLFRNESSFFMLHLIMPTFDIVGLYHRRLNVNGFDNNKIKRIAPI